MYDDADIVVFDGRRCPHHGCIISSPDGMFDGPCPACEHEMYLDAMAWECDPENPQRRYCNDGSGGVSFVTLNGLNARCVPFTIAGDSDDIPF